MAARRGDPQSIRLLLDARAEVLAGFKDDRWTALHSAASEGHDAALQLLVSDGEVPAPWRLFLLFEKIGWSAEVDNVLCR